MLYGPRRVGKTELIKKMMAGYEGKIFSGSGDNQEVRELLSTQKFNQLQSAFGNYHMIFIDEAQRIPEVGYGLKLLIDNFPQMTILVTGSSSFDLSNKIGEPLTGKNVHHQKSWWIFQKPSKRDRENIPLLLLGQWYSKRHC